MADKFLHQLKKGAHSCFDDSKKRKQVIQQLQQIEYFDIIHPDKEQESSGNDL